MAHELYQIDGNWSMAFVGDTPWHGLGQNLQHDSSLEVWAKEAQLEWEVKSAPVSFDITDFKGLNLGTQMDLEQKGNRIAVEGRKVLYRSDDGHPLSVVSDRYKPVQPAQILEFFRSLIDNHDFTMQTAGSLKRGQRIWALASTKNNGTIMGQERIGQYLTICTSCDGSLSTIAFFTNICIVCNNTLSYAYMNMQKHASDMEDSKLEYRDIVKVPHSALWEPDKVKIEMGLVDDYFKQFMEDASNLAEHKVTEADAFDFFCDVLKKGEDDLENVSEITLRRLFQSYKGGVGQDIKARKGTAWGLVNAVTYFADHARPAHSQDTRLNSAWFGDGNRLKAKAMSTAVDFFLKAA
jgi:phage/plasmid-like protein (TIGR03299 family)